MKTNEKKTRINPKGGKQFTSKYQPKKNGRKKGIKSIKTIIESFLFQDIQWQDIKGKPKKMQVIDAMVASQIKKAYQEGDLSAFKELLDRSYGKVKDKTEITGNIPIEITIFKKEPNGKDRSSD